MINFEELKKFYIDHNINHELFDFNEDLYGKTIEVIFRQKIREELKFSGLDELKSQISADVEQVREIFGVTN